MKWDFFYDEGYNEPYQSVKDWHEDIKHLVPPLIVLAAICIFILISAKFLLSLK